MNFSLKDSLSRINEKGLLHSFCFLSSTVNSRPPVLHVNGSLLVPLGALAPLHATLLQVTDPDSPSERFVFSLVQAPSNGELLLFGEEGRGGGTEGRQLNRGDTFGWADLRGDRVRFRHRRDKARSVRGCNYLARIRVASNPSGKCQVSPSSQRRADIQQWCNEKPLIIKKNEYFLHPGNNTKNKQPLYIFYINVTFPSVETFWSFPPRLVAPKVTEVMQSLQVAQEHQE